MFLIAHGIVGRSDLPIPSWLFGWAAAVVLVVSFVGLAVLWPTPRLQDGGGFRPIAGWASRVLCSRVVDVLCGVIGVALFVLVLYTGYAGEQVATANFAPNFVLVIFWVGLVPVSVLFGDVYRAFNPWRAVGRFVSWVASKATSGPMPSALDYPERLGYIPAGIGLFLFTALELVDNTNGSLPKNVATATLVYSAATFVAMALYGVEAWCRRGDAFSVYFNLFSRVGPWVRKGDQIGLRRPLAGLTQVRTDPGLVFLLAVMIGTTTFDGAGEGELWNAILPGLRSVFETFGFGLQNALRASFAVGLVACVAIIYGLYRLGIAGARSVGGGWSNRELANRFVHTLVPIALAYVMAHYLTYLLYQGQSMRYLVSNPLGHEGTDLFGTANEGIDYSVMGAKTAWYFQVAFVVIGHVAALTLAHDRALAIYTKAKLAVRSQYWMLVVMVGFTSLALWLLSQSNT